MIIIKYGLFFVNLTLVLKYAIIRLIKLVLSFKNSNIMKTRILKVIAVVIVFSVAIFQPFILHLWDRAVEGTQKDLQKIFG
jgi:hypothetical protein